MIPSGLTHLIKKSDERFGNFNSTHEALGVALEEWHELIEAIHAGDRIRIHSECLDLAAVCVRLANQINSVPELKI